MPAITSLLVGVSKPSLSSPSNAFTLISSPNKQTKITDVVPCSPGAAEVPARGTIWWAGRRAARLAALIFRAKFGDDKSQTPFLQNILPELLPRDILKANAAQEWKRLILAHYNQDSQLLRRGRQDRVPQGPSCLLVSRDGDEGIYISGIFSNVF